ncbi:MAG: septal ring lytic transglycosylase RlpA family protein [Gammaproteobacteria bacterium]
MRIASSHNYPAARYRAKAGYLAMLAMIIGLLDGCATKPVVAPEQSSSSNAHGTDGSKHRAAYNRPYRVKGRTYYPMKSADGYREYGIASWYGSESGNTTAMGTRFRPEGVSAAHKTLPLPSRVRVTNLHNNRSIIVLVNDRGPFKKGRLIDLSHGAAKRLGIRGLARVKVEYIDDSQANAAAYR